MGVRKKKPAKRLVKVGDSVNHPPHYNQAPGMECIDAIEAATFDKTGIEAVCTGNVIKYIWRYPAKKKLEDVKKCRYYLEKLIKVLESKEKNG